MRHRRKQAKLGVKAAHRKSMLMHLAQDLVEHHRIRTTVDRAKEARRHIERLVTLAKRGTLHARRLVAARLQSKTGVRKLFQVIAPAFNGSHGGYTRIIREAFRNGDGAQMVIFEFSRTIELPETKAADEKKAKKEKLRREGKLEETPLVKKDKIVPAKEKELKPKLKKTEEKPLSPGEETQEDKEKAQKKGGFLSTLRKFLKGE